MSFFKKHKWYLVTSVVIILLFIATALWLYFATDNPQLAPFQYQVF